MPAKKDNRLAWGITLLVFGCLFLCRQLHIIPSGIGSYLFDVRSYLMITGVIFLIFHSNKTIGWVFLTFGVLFRIPDIIKLTQNISDYIWPALLIIAGAILVFGMKKGK